jgi:hypothetical protein
LPLREAQQKGTCKILSEISPVLSSAPEKRIVSIFTPFEFQLFFSLRRANSACKRVNKGDIRLIPLYGEE